MGFYIVSLNSIFLTKRLRPRCILLWIAFGVIGLPLPARSLEAVATKQAALCPVKLIVAEEATLPEGCHSHLTIETPDLIPRQVSRSLVEAAHPLPSDNPPAPDSTQTSSISLDASPVFLSQEIDVVPDIDVAPDIIESSPVLQRWLEDVPDIATDIQHDPAFRTRVRLGYSEFPSADDVGGVYVGVQDVFVGQTPLTLSADYSVSSDGELAEIGADAQYYLLPLGWYGNVAPVIGYRSVDTPDFHSAGINLGLKIILIPSRTGAADLSLTQTWIAPGTDQEVGLTTFSAGYAIAEDIRIGTDIQTQNTRDRQESRVSLLVEWMP